MKKSVLWVQWTLNIERKEKLAQGLAAVFLISRNYERILGDSLLQTARFKGLNVCANFYMKEKSHSHKRTHKFKLLAKSRDAVRSDSHPHTQKFKHLIMYWKALTKVNFSRILAGFSKAEK